MPGPVIVDDIVYIYSLLAPLAHDMQRTRSTLRMITDTGLSVLAAAHMPVGPKEQNLTPQQQDLKAFKSAVSTARSKWDYVSSVRSRDAMRGVIPDTDPRLVELIQLINYGAVQAPAGDTRVTRMMARLLLRDWDARKCNDVGGWTPPSQQY